MDPTPAVLGPCPYLLREPLTQDSRVTNKRRGWVPEGELSKSKTIFARGKRFTTIAAMCTKGLVSTKTFEGASDKSTFMNYIVELVVSTGRGIFYRHMVLMLPLFGSIGSL